MIEAPVRPVETRVEKPDRLNLANMVYQVRFLKEADALDLQPQNWEVYVKSKYDDELEHIQRFTPDGKVSIVTRDRVNVEYHEYDYDYALEFLNQDVITVEEPKQYRTYVTDFSLVHNPEMDPSLEADSLRVEFSKMHAEVGIDLEQEALERREEDRVRAEEDELRVAAIKVRNDALNTAEEIELAKARAEIETLVPVENVSPMPLVEVPSAPKEEVISVFTHGLPKGFVMGEPSFEDEEAVVLAVKPTLGEIDFLNWPHIEVEAPRTNGNGNGHKNEAEIHSATEVEPEIPEGCKLVEFKNGQKRLKRISDGKFVGKDGLTKKERGETVIPRERKPRAPRVEVVLESKPAVAEHEIVNFREIVLQPDEFNIVYLDGSQLRDLAPAQRENLSRVVKNLRVDADILTLEELIKNMFGIDVKLVPPHKVSVHN